MDWTQIITALISSGVVLAGYILVDKREKNKQLDNFKADVISTLNAHREEYIQGINDVKSDITQMQASYQTNSATLDIRLDYLVKEFNDMKVEVREHNNFAKKMPVIEEQIKVANHRIDDLEDYAKS